MKWTMVTKNVAGIQGWHERDVRAPIINSWNHESVNNNSNNPFSCFSLVSLLFLQSHRCERLDALNWKHFQCNPLLEWKTESLLPILYSNRNYYTTRFREELLASIAIFFSLAELDKRWFWEQQLNSHPKIIILFFTQQYLKR